MDTRRIPTVCEFPDVFLAKLPGMPPPRAVEFAIELAPEAKPVSLPHLRMTSAEFIRLRAHLDELQQKGFIHPSSSPWRPLVFF